MIKDPKKREQVKRYLIIGNIVLAVILSIMILFWLLSIRPGQIEKAAEAGQYVAFSMNELPNTTSIEADYIGRTTKQNEPALNAKNNWREEDNVKSHNVDSEDGLFKKTEELLNKSHQLLADKKEIANKENKIEKNFPIKKDYKGPAKIGIIVTNLGLNRRSTELALTLPKQCGLGFLPYTKSLKPILNQAQTNGHEIYLYLPLETIESLDNPGKYALMTNLAPEENAVRLNIILNSHTKYDGVYSSYKEIFTDNFQASEMILDNFEDKNLIFVMGKGATKDTESRFKARKNIIPTNIIIDEEPDKEAISKQLQKLIETAKNEGVALGYAQGFILTIEMIREWIPLLKKKNINLVPISELLREYNL